MQQLTVKKLCGSVSQCAPENIPSILDNAGIGYEKIACDNWNWAKCNPDVQFRIAHDGANIVLQFVVDDHEIRGVEIGNDSRVWEDSFLVTGNLKHYPRRPCVVTPAEFLEMIKTSPEREDN